MLDRDNYSDSVKILRSTDIGNATFHIGQAINTYNDVIEVIVNDTTSIRLGKRDHSLLLMLPFVKKIRLTEDLCRFIGQKAYGHGVDSNSPQDRIARMSVAIRTALDNEDDRRRRLCDDRRKRIEEEDENDLIWKRRQWDIGADEYWKERRSRELEQMAGGLPSEEQRRIELGPPSTPHQPIPRYTQGTDQMARFTLTLNDAFRKAGRIPKFESDKILRVHPGMFVTGYLPGIYRTTIWRYIRSDGTSEINENTNRSFQVFVGIPEEEFVGGRYVALNNDRALLYWELPSLSIVIANTDYDVRGQVQGLTGITESFTRRKIAKPGRHLLDLEQLMAQW